MSDESKELNLLTDETIKVICVLHYIDASLISSKVINFINKFVKKRVETKISVDEYFLRYYMSGKDNLFDNVKISKFKEAYALFSKADTIDCKKYYYDLMYLKQSVYDMILIDITKYYKIECKLDNRDQIGILTHLIKFDLNNPFKYKSQPYTSANINDNFLYAFNEILDVRTERPYSYLESKEITIEVKKEVIQILNSHLSSKKHVPKYSKENHKSVRELIRYLKDSLITWNNCIFIVPKKVNHIEIYGNVFHKSNEVLLSKENVSTIVTDKLMPLNNPEFNNYTIYMVDEEGTLSRYVEATGELHQEGYVRVS